MDLSDYVKEFRGLHKTRKIRVADFCRERMLDYYEMVEALKKDKFLCLSIRQRLLSDPTFGHLQSKRSSWE